MNGFMQSRTQIGLFSEFVKRRNLIAKQAFPDNAAQVLQTFFRAKLLTGISEDLKNENEEVFWMEETKILHTHGCSITNSAEHRCLSYFTDQPTQKNWNDLHDDLTEKASTATR